MALHRFNLFIPIKRKGNLKNEHGAAILETMIAMLLLLSIMFGIMQIFQLSLANMITEYASFRGARSIAVGFNDDLAEREAKIKLIPASGDMVHPDKTTAFYNPQNQFSFEKNAIERFMRGTQWLEYSRWGNAEIRHTNYHCPYYGQPMNGECGVCGENGGYVHSTSNSYNEEVHYTLEMRNYRMNIPLSDYFLGGEEICIEKETELRNHSSAILE